VLRGFGALSPDRLSCIDTQGLSLIVTLMSEIVTGEAYVEAITSRESDRRARAAFQDLVLRIARPGAALFDFGAGPGLDARLYAERGFTVTAYDIDPKMREFFSVYCREFIETGKILLYGAAIENSWTGTTQPNAGLTWLRRTSHRSIWSAICANYLRSFMFSPDQMAMYLPAFSVPIGSAT
jgi:hypothetical protein